MTHDLIVIGGGPAGYVAAERAGAQGLRVLLVEQDLLGGVCLNVGCIPSKALLNAAKHYHNAAHGEAYGVMAGNARFDMARAQAHKEKVKNTLRKGVAGLMKKFKVEVISGTAALRPDHTVAVGDAVYQAPNVLVATGSSPAKPPIPGSELPHVVDSTGMLAAQKLPDSLVVIGGGIIGCEFACCFGSLGVPVTVIEMLPEICPSIDPDLARLLRTELTARNVTFHTGARVSGIDADAVTFAVDGEEQHAPAACVLVATGRRPNVRGIGLEDIRVDFDDKGIRIDDRCATNVPGIWAAGDVTGRTWLAHAASRMGEVVVRNITGHPDRMRYHALAGVIYTNPEVASVGLTEAGAAKRGIPVKTAKLPMTINGRFLAEHADGRGLVKLVAHAETRALLGVHLVGGACSEMIYGAAAMIEMETRLDELVDVVFPHPAACEVIREAAISMLHE